MRIPPRIFGAEGKAWRLGNVGVFLPCQRDRVLLGDGEGEREKEVSGHDMIAQVCMMMYGFGRGAFKVDRLGTGNNTQALNWGFSWREKVLSEFPHLHHFPSLIALYKWDFAGRSRAARRWCL